MKFAVHIVLMMMLVLPASAQELFPEAEVVLNPEGRNKIKPSTFNFLKTTTHARIAGWAMRSPRCPMGWTASFGTRPG